MRDSHLFLEFVRQYDDADRLEWIKQYDDTSTLRMQVTYTWNLDSTVGTRTEYDATGQTLAYACERLLEAGALDTYIVPIIMKKGRPGQLLTVLCRPSDAARLETLVLAETSTFGVRSHQAGRTKLARRHETVETRYGPLRIKLGELGGKLVQAWPEYEECAAAARKTGVPLREVQQEVLRVWSREHDVPRHRI